MTKSEILSQLANGKISVEEAGVALEATESGARLYCKVSSKGGMSLYGLQRMPVTLYVQQWERLLAFSDDLRTFLKAHNEELKRKVKGAPAAAVDAPATPAPITGKSKGKGKKAKAVAAEAPAVAESPAVAPVVPTEAPAVPATLMGVPVQGVKAAA